MLSPSSPSILLPQNQQSPATSQLLNELQQNLRENAVKNGGRADGGEEVELGLYFKEIEFYLKIEDENGCSGMCEPSLFFFGEELHEGSPKKTCHQPLKEFLSGSALAFSIFAMSTGIIATLQFLLHFALLNRPIPANPTQSATTPKLPAAPKGAKDPLDDVAH